MLKVCLRVRALDKVKNAKRGKLERVQMDSSVEKDVRRERSFEDGNELLSVRLC